MGKGNQGIIAGTANRLTSREPRISARIGMGILLGQQWRLARRPDSHSAQIGGLVQTGCHGGAPIQQPQQLSSRKPLHHNRVWLVPGDGVEPSVHGFTDRCLDHLATLGWSGAHLLHCFVPRVCTRTWASR